MSRPRMVGPLLAALAVAAAYACSSTANPSAQPSSGTSTDQASTAACDAPHDLGVVSRACADLIVFMDPAAAQVAVDAVAAALRSDPAVVEFTFSDHQDAFEEFKALMSDETNPGPNIEPRDLPTSYRLRLVDNADATAERARYKTLPGVKEVTFD